MPAFAYPVSGEYVTLKAAAQNGWLDERMAVMEVMACFKRAAPATASWLATPSRWRSDRGSEVWG